MSWYYEGHGKPRALAQHAKAQLAATKCGEPAETIKGKVSEIIETALAGLDERMAVKIEASGSQSENEEGRSNTLKLEITPLGLFRE